MGALHQPDLEPGPHRDLVEALHRLHRDAGRPSLRTIARRAGCSHTTVFHVLCHPRLPPWELIELVVSAMAGDPVEFRSSWVDATAEGIRHVPPPGRAIAGRRAELLVVRRHLESGSGLLLVVGRAGLGKTTLVDTASQQVSTFVAHARGVPVLSDEPFALATNALREVHRCDEGRWLREALASCPRFVAPSLARIVPELHGAGSDGDDTFARERLVAAIRSTFLALAALRPLALVLEDLHAADPSSLACLDELAVGGRGVPVVGTFRTGASAAADAWLRRVRGDAHLLLNLPPLSEKESREQLHLLAGRWLSRSELDRIHRVTRGVPLFTEELVRAQPYDGPVRFDDLLSRHLEDLSPVARAVLVPAAVADRSLPEPVVTAVASMGESELADGRRELVARHLLAGPYGTPDVGVRHPLLAAALRSRLAPSEATSAHRRLATVLAASAHPSPTEVAEHWRGAQNAREELPWRVAAARAACGRLALSEEAAHWARALELWPTDGPPPADAGTTRAELLLEVVHSSLAAGRAVDVPGLVEEARAHAPTSPVLEHALALGRASHAVADVDPDSAERLAGEAVRVHELLGDRVGMVRAMGDRSRALRAAGRYDDADAVVAEALSLSDGIAEPALHRDVLIERAWLDIATGRILSGLRSANAASLMSIEDDPFGDVWSATYHTDLLLMLCAGGDQVAEAARAGLASAHAAGIKGSVLSTVLVCNVAEARIGDGAVPAASRLLRSRSSEEPRRTTRFLHLTRAWVEVLRGELEVADRRLESVRSLGFGLSAHRQGLLSVQALCDVWRGLPTLALDHLGRDLAGETATSWSPYTGALLLLAAHAAADVAQAEPARRHELTSTLWTWQHQWSQDPFSADAPHAAAPASRSTWRAELGRLTGTARVADWVGAADQWDLVGRPHDAAYCRWRAAEVALHDGDRGLSARLLRRAHAQARAHVPLLAVIDRSRAALLRASEVDGQAVSSSRRLPTRNRETASAACRPAREAPMVLADGP